MIDLLTSYKRIDEASGMNQIKITFQLDRFGRPRHYLSYGGVPVGRPNGYLSQRAAETAKKQIDQDGRTK